MRTNVNSKKVTVEATAAGWDGGIRTVSLTPREAQVLRLLVKGLYDEEIASRLKIGHGTVRTHIRQIFQKFGVSNRVQVAVWAVTHRWTVMFQGAPLCADATDRGRETIAPISELTGRDATAGSV